MHHAPVVRATLWMMGALLSFMLMAIGGRELSGNFSTFEILFFRSLIGLAILLPLLTKAGWQTILPKQPGIHLLRNTAHFGGQAAWFYGLGLIPLAEVFAIEFTTPVWTALLAALLLGERLTRSRLLAIAFGFAGILVILRPGLEVINPVSLIVLGGAIGYATSHTLTKQLTRDNAAITILFYMTLIQLPIGLLLAMPSWHAPSLSDLPWLITVGATALTAHYCMARALALSDATIVVPMDFLRLPLIALIGWLVYQESIDLWLITGALIILLGNWINVFQERKNHLSTLGGNSKH